MGIKKPKEKHKKDDIPETEVFSKESSLAPSEAASDISLDSKKPFDDDVDTSKTSPKSNIKKQPEPKQLKKIAILEEQEKPKLKKTPKQRPKEPSPEMEKITLKHHEFEPKPLEVPKEEE